ncbi:MAG: carbon storage regulator [Oscillospiraceae bacterium]|jgi:sRNA-binding carbon storage regulator CsrA|nr:carbon storage regulator [Oscillospiraceae bacterium]MCI9289003.1 carbon storage regulator [Oscillospiraceae bacterium]MCI9551287.1 carbon storage regulator [Oscillospiraceae bacterium]
MLKLSLAPGEYLTIGENVVVQVYRAENGRTYLAIDAPREVPIVRGAVREREGAQPPAKLAQVPQKGHKSGNPI